jgi:hypothetical protein
MARVEEVECGQRRRVAVPPLWINDIDYGR